MARSALFGLMILCCGCSVVAEPSPQGKYVCDFYPVSGALTFLANNTFNIDILLRGSITIRTFQMKYKLVTTRKIKISDFAIPIKFFFIVKYDENSIVTEWGQEEGIFDHEEML
ncbi:hypothetical protein FOZ60_001859 [Perkinsus olseni]|uniref:Uncharacterized protein n=1 Tax=Perkinsus olseni TaxID=32597 RepID=A0A7J6PJ68_PEROL|nr:hypothetical protein FOZ60_001859 [Perkinsus olseni]